MDGIKDRIECWFTSKDINILKEERKKRKIKQLNIEIEELKKENIKYLQFEKKAFDRANEFRKNAIMLKKLSKTTKDKQRKKALEMKAIRALKDSYCDYQLLEKYGNQASKYNKRINDLRCSCVDFDNIISIKNTTENMKNNKIDIEKSKKIIDEAINFKEDKYETDIELKGLLKDLEAVDLEEEDILSDDENKITINDIESESLEEDSFEYPVIINNNKYISNNEYDDENEKELQYE